MCDLLNSSDSGDLTNSPKVYNLSECELPISFLEYRDDQCGYYIIMDVGEPVTITTRQSFGRSTSFTTYLIRIETNYPTFSNTFSAVRRRYSEFLWLKDQLLSNHLDEEVPQLPPKKYLPFINFNSNFIRQRLGGLSKYLQSILETPSFLSDPSLLFFLQSELSIQEMENETKSPSFLLESLPDSLCISSTTTNSTADNSHSKMDSCHSSSTHSKPESSNSKLAISRRISTESNRSDESDRTSDSSKGDSGHFEGSGSPTSSTKDIVDYRKLNKRRGAVDYGRGLPVLPNSLGLDEMREVLQFNPIVYLIQS